MKKQYLKKSAAVVLAFLLVLSLASCGETKQSQADGSGESIKDKIAAIDGVLSIEAVENNQSDWLPERYVVMVEQQIDWNDPDAGTFPQRVEVGIHPGAEVNILETNGYMFLDGDLTSDEQA